MRNGIDAFDIYMTECGNHRLLEADEERELILAAQAGDAAAKETLMRCNQRLIIKIANKYTVMAGDQTLADLIQWGQFGLMEAIQRFEVTRGLRFSTYAAYWVRSYVRRFAMDRGMQVSSSHGDNEMRFKIARTSERMAMGKGGYPSITEVANKLGINPEKATEVWNASGATQIVYSLDHDVVDDAVDDTSFTPISYKLPSTPGVEDEATERISNEVLKKHVAALPDRQRVIMTRYYGLDGETPATLAEIGEKLGCSRERVRQIQNAAIKHLRVTLIIGGHEA